MSPEIPNEDRKNKRQKIKAKKGKETILCCFCKPDYKVSLFMGVLKR